MYINNQSWFILIQRFQQRTHTFSSSVIGLPSSSAVKSAYATDPSHEQTSSWKPESLLQAKPEHNLNTNWLPDTLRGERVGRGDSNIKGTASSGLAEIHVQNCDSISNYNFACSFTIMSTAITYSFKVFMFLISKQFLGVCRVDIMYLFVNIYLWYCQISYVKSSLTLTCTDFCQEDLPGYIHDWVIE